ncbi:alpha/beta hydrolase, partial [Francisella philomiragia]
YDYSAAIAMSEFAGQKLAIIIDYLKQNGIKVNIMAHSLGNAVTMNTLKNVSTPVDQAICWEPAIANDSLSNSNRNEAVQDIATSYHKLDSQGKPISDIAVQQYNVSYNYAAAASKADKFTIAYSNLDEMLGPIPNIPSLFKKGEIQSMTMNEAVNRMITHVLVSVSSYYFSTAKIGT